jgi:uncharacterized membrane protein
MTWNHRYRIRSYLRSSLWIVPIGALGIEFIVWAFVYMLDARINWSGLGFGLEGARVVGSTVITLTLSFVVFTFGSLLVAIQVASGQYTPRIIATTLLSDNVIRFTVGLFVFTLMFAIKSLNQMETTVPQMVTFITGVLGLLCLIAFLFLIDYTARLLRPVSLVRRVGQIGRAVIEGVYPEELTGEECLPVVEQNAGAVARTVLQRGSSGIALAVDVNGLVTIAERTGSVIEFASQVGDFVGTDEPLFLLHGGGATIDDSALCECVIFGSERTMEKDPLFAFRILVDIAIKGLSPAINDPTTAVLAIDQLHRLVRSVGKRRLRTDYIFNSAGRLRVILRTPNWEDFIHLAFTEIRCYGASNFQIARRLRAMIVNLSSTLPPERQSALDQQLDLLDRMLDKLYVLPEDLALARIPDPQGLGGSTNSTAPACAA